MRPLPTVAKLRAHWRWPLAFALLAALVAAAQALPERARRYAERSLTASSGASARIGALAFDPRRLALRIDGLCLRDAGGALVLAADAVTLDLALDSLWTHSLHLDALTLRGARGQLDLLAGGGIRPQLRAGGAGGAPLRLRIDHLAVTASALLVRDLRARPLAALRLTELGASADGFDSQATAAMPLRLHGRIGAGTLRLQAQLQPATQALAGRLAVQDMDAGPALAYLERAVPVTARGGRIDAHATLMLGGDGALRLSDGHLALRQAALTDGTGAPLARIAALAVDGLALDVAARRVSLGRISGHDNWLALRRAADGRLELQPLTRPTGDGKAGPGWQVTAGALVLTGQRLDLSDATLQPPLHQELTLEQLEVGALGSREPVPVRLSARLAGGGSVQLTGTAALPAGPARLELSAKDLPLPPLAPYLPDLGPLALRSGTAAASGQLTLGAPGPEFRGQLTLSHLDLWDTERHEALLAARTLRVDQLVANAQGLASSKIWINRPMLRASITESRRSNLSRFGLRPAAPAAGAPPTHAGSAPRRFAVATVRISRGTLHLEDHSLRPHFAVSIEGLKGNIDGLASDAREPARLALSGRIDQYAPATVAGHFTVGVPRNAAFKLSFTGVEMATFAPYVSKFAGYRIERGTLDVDLDYTVTGPQVLGQNRIILNRLVLGQRVDSPDALDLPLTLALAVLKDSRGVIDVALPLRGDLANLQFDYSALLGKALRALVVKAARAPFSVLARLVGASAADLRTVAFAPGSAQLPAAQQQAVQKVAQALAARPQLTLRIRPQADQNDARALAEQALGAALGQAAADDDGPADGQADWSERLTRLYAQRFGHEPPPVAPPAGSRPSAAAARAAAARAGRERLLAAMAPDAAALRALAQARGAAIGAALVDNGLPARRLAIELPAADAPLPASATSELALGTP